MTTLTSGAIAGAMVLAAEAASGSVAAEEPFGQIDALARVLELELDAISGCPRADAHLAAERGGESVLGCAEGVLEVRVDDDRAEVAPPALAVFDLARAAFRLAHGPALRARLARELQPPRLVLHEQERAAVAAREVARLDHRERLVRQLEQADQVGDGHPATADAPADLLLGDPEVVDERRARSRLLDRVEVLARHVLDERQLESLALVGVANDRRHLADPGDHSGAEAALAGHELEVAAGERPHDDGLQDPAGLD